MARQLVLFALALLAVVSLAYAAEPTPATTAAATITPVSAAPTSDDHDHIGATDDDGAGSAGGDDIVAAPIGGPVPEGAFGALSPSQSPASGATALKVSAVAGGVATVAGFFFF